MSVITITKENFDQQVLQSLYCWIFGRPGAVPAACFPLW